MARSPSPSSLFIAAGKAQTVVTGRMGVAGIAISTHRNTSSFGWLGFTPMPKSKSPASRRGAELPNASQPVNGVGTVAGAIIGHHDRPIADLIRAVAGLLIVVSSPV